MQAGVVLAGRYRLVEQLGEGAMGAVWRAHSLAFNADVAVKLIRSELLVSPEAVTRFRREAQAAAAIRNSHVVQVLDYGIDAGTPFIAMELLHGESLRSRLESAFRLTPAVTAQLLNQVARAIAIAHEHRIIHRDLKPENIFLAREFDTEVTKVLDFGIARQLDASTDGIGLHTKTGAILGTPYYMSPEQLNAQEVDHRTDVWSFGVIACECLTGRRAFDGESFLKLGNAICLDPLPVPSSLGPVPAGFDEWFARTVARDCAQRFSSIMRAAAALNALCNPSDGQRETVRSTPPPEHASPTEADSARVLDSRPPGSSSGAEVVEDIGTTVAPSARSVPSLSATLRARKTFALIATAGLAAIIVWYTAARRAVSASATSGLAQTQSSQVAVPAASTTALLADASVYATERAGIPSGAAETVATGGFVNAVVSAAPRKSGATQSRGGRPNPPVLGAARSPRAEQTVRRGSAPASTNGANPLFSTRD